MSEGPLALLFTDPHVEEVHVDGGRVVVVGQSRGQVSPAWASKEDLLALVERLCTIGGCGDE